MTPGMAKWALWLACGVICVSCASDPAESSGPATGTSGTGTSATGGTTGSPVSGSAAATSGAPAAGTGQGTAAAPAAGGGGTAPGGGSVDCAALPLPASEDDIVATFEDGTGAVKQAGGRGGGFYMFNDGTGTQTPPPGPLPPATAVTRCASTYALCMSGKNFTTWGAGMGTDFAPTMGDAGTGTKQTYDASAYKAVAFWAKANTMPVSLRVGFKDQNTAPEGGKCDAAAVNGAEACNDDWGKALSLTTEWKPFTITFAELTQAGWGKAFSAFDAMHVYSIQLQVAQGVEFDLCLDDLVLVR